MAHCLFCGGKARLQERLDPSSTYCSKQCCNVLFVGVQSQRKTTGGKQPAQWMKLQRQKQMERELLYHAQERGYARILDQPPQHGTHTIQYQTQVVQFNTIDQDMYQYLITLNKCDNIEYDFYMELLQQVRDNPTFQLVLTLTKNIVQGLCIYHYILPNGDDYPMNGLSPEPIVADIKLLCTPPGLGMGRVLMNVLSNRVLDPCTYHIELCSVDEAVGFYLALGFRGVSRDGRPMNRPPNMSTRRYKAWMRAEGIYSDDTGYKMALPRQVHPMCQGPRPPVRTTGC